VDTGFPKRSCSNRLGMIEPKAGPTAGSGVTRWCSAKRLTRCTACLGRASRCENILLFVIAGLDPAIHAVTKLIQTTAWSLLPHVGMDHRVKPGGDEGEEAGELLGHLSQAATPPHPDPLPASGERGSPGITMRERAQQIFAVAEYSAFTGPC